MNLYIVTVNGAVHAFWTAEPALDLIWASPRYLNATLKRISLATMLKAV